MAYGASRNKCIHIQRSMQCTTWDQMLEQMCPHTPDLLYLGACQLVFVLKVSKSINLAVLPDYMFGCVMLSGFEGCGQTLNFHRFVSKVM